jgi:hypothetical protein
LCCCCLGTRVYSQVRAGTRQPPAS